MNYPFQNLLGAPYRGGNAVITQNTQLISPVGNRVSVTDLNKHHTVTLPVNSSSNICRLAASPDDTFLLAVDEENRCLNRVGALKFNPDGKFIAIGMGKLVQIWRSPGFRRAVFAFELVRTFANYDDKVVSLAWSLDSDYLLVGSNDLAARLLCVRKLKGVLNKPFLFLGHRDSVVGCFFGVDKITNKLNKAFTIARDGYIFSWGYSGKDPKLEESEDYSEPPSPDTPERADEVTVENGGGVGTDLKKRKEYEEYLPLCRFLYGPRRLGR